MVFKRRRLWLLIVSAAGGRPEPDPVLRLLGYRVAKVQRPIDKSANGGGHVSAATTSNMSETGGTTLPITHNKRKRPGLFWVMGKGPDIAKYDVLRDDQISEETMKNLTGNLIKGNLKAVSILSHRYARAVPGFKDYLVYHAVAVLEWTQGDFVTIVEVGFLDGLCKEGQSLWYGNSVINGLKQSPCSFSKTKSEIRVFDLFQTPDVANGTDAHAVLRYMERHPESFIDPSIVTGTRPSDSDLSRSRIAEGLKTYAQCSPAYVELGSLADRSWAANCQTFVADFYEWITGSNPGAATWVVRRAYKPHPDYFKTCPALGP